MASTTACEACALTLLATSTNSREEPSSNEPEADEVAVKVMSAATPSAASSDVGATLSLHISPLGLWPNHVRKRGNKDCTSHKYTMHAFSKGSLTIEFGWVSPKEPANEHLHCKKSRTEDIALDASSHNSAKTGSGRGCGTGRLPVLWGPI
eukprot:1148519-Pelagomonas_calceolata.AAC.5